MEGLVKISVRPEAKREIDILAASLQMSVCDLAAEMLREWKEKRGVASMDTLPHPQDAQPVPVVTVSQ